MSDQRVALCPVTPELADRLIGLAALDLTDDAAVAYLLAHGWRDHAEAVTGPEYEQAYDAPDDANFVSQLGHFTYCDGDGSFLMPFSQLYWINNEVLRDDLWAMLPGWTSQVGAWRDEYDAQAEAVVQLFTERLGPPRYDIRQPKYHGRDVSWCLDTNVLMVTQTTEPYSYHQFEHAAVYIGSRTAEHTYFPDSPAMRALVTS
jgi:hypothetical protein